MAIALGNFQLVNITTQNNPLITWNSCTDLYSLTRNRGKKVVLQSFSFPNFRWSQSYIKSRFDLAIKYSSQCDALIFLMQEEIYQPTASTGFQGVPMESANGASYVLEGVTIPAMPQAGSEAFFVALLRAWKALCVRLNKKAALCGSPTGLQLNVAGVFKWIYSLSGLSYIATNYNMIFLYRYPQSVSQANGITKGHSAKEYIDYWRRGLGYSGLINYILVTKFTDGAGTTDLKVIDADFKNAYFALNNNDIISAYPYALQSLNDTSATERLIQLYNIYKGDTNMANKPTIVCLGDARPSKFGNKGITDLTLDMNKLVAMSPTGQVDAIFMIGDMDPVPKAYQAYQASTANNIPIYWIMGNHELATSGDKAFIQSHLPTNFSVLPGPAGTEKTTYSVNIGGIHVIVCDIYWENSGGVVGSKLLPWIEANLKAATTKYKVFMVHEPLYPSKRHVGDSLDSNKTARDALQKVLNDNGCDVVVAAHTHYASASLHNKVVHFDAGVSGAKIIDGADPYTSMIFMYVDDVSGDMKAVWKHDEHKWDNPVVKTYSISQGTITPPPDPEPDLNLTAEQLLLHPAYVAIQGKIYNMVKSSTWVTGTHHSHTGGRDLTSALLSEHSLNKVVGAFPKIGNLIPMPPPTNPNIIKNPGFEMGVPAHWIFTPTGNNVPTWDTGIFHTGSKSAKISIPGTVVVESGLIQSETIHALPSTTYVASAWGKTQNCGGNTPAVRVVELDINNVYIKQTNILPVFDKGTSDWEQRTLEFTTDIRTANLYIYANIWKGYGNFWLDDVELRLK